MAPAAAPVHPRIVVGVSGGIAAYKAVTLVRELVRRGADVTVIPTGSAVKFVGTPTWEAVSRNAVSTELFEDVATVRHVALGQNADLIVLAPATAHTMASMAAGLAGDLLGTTLLASSAPVLIAPAMHADMWEHPSVRANVATLTQRGVHVVGPETGDLTGGDVGAGRMVEPEEIAEIAWGLLAPQTLVGKTVLVSAGGTREPLDPVRFIGNRSSGEMGVSVARTAQARGASVILVAANLEVAPPAGVSVVDAPTAHQMREAMVAHRDHADVVIMAAAVADWVAAEVSSRKLSKSDLGESYSPHLVRAPDILAELGASKPPKQILVGFAAESAENAKDREKSAKDKLKSKKLDAIVLNHVGDRLGFGPVQTTVTLFFSASPQSLSVEGNKHSIAGYLLDALLDR